MAAVTTFLVGAVVGGGVKWAYDKWQAKEDKPDLSVAAVREKSSAAVHSAGQSVRNLVRRQQDAPEAEAVEVPPAAEDAAAAA